MGYLELHHIAKRYGSVSVVEDISLSAQAGEFVVLVGASGCGKSTTLRMIAGLEAPSDGRIIIDGHDVTQVSPSARDVAMVFQNYALYPHMNVAQNMSFALELARTPRADVVRRVEAAAQILSISHLLARRPKELSGGQRQRVAMGRAIVREPKVFLFDEPLSNLDARLRGHMRIEIALLHRRLGKTTVYVTHDQIEAMTLADRIVVMDQGRIQQVGSPDAVFNRPLNRFVAGFIGSPTMNFLDVVVQEDGAGLYFVGEGVRCPVPAALHASVRRRLGQPVVLGVRPQSLRLGPSAGIQALTLTLQVQVCEYLGTESVISATLQGAAGTTVVVSVPGNHSGSIGQMLTVHAAPDSLFAFEPGGHGRALGLEDATT